MENVSFFSMDRKTKKEYDAILITHMDEKAAVNLKRELMDEGVSKNIIKWDNSVYRAKDLYDNAFINLLRNKEQIEVVKNGLLNESIDYYNAK